MQNSIWKLTTLAGVIGVGFLIVLQAQDGLKQDDQEQHALVPAGQPGPADGNVGDAKPSGELSQAAFWQPGQSVGPDELRENTEPPVADQSEPVFGPGSSGFASRPRAQRRRSGCCPTRPICPDCHRSMWSQLLPMHSTRRRVSPIHPWEWLAFRSPTSARTHSPLTQPCLTATSQRHCRNLVDWWMNRVSPSPQS